MKRVTRNTAPRCNPRALAATLLLALLSGCREEPAEPPLPDPMTDSVPRLLPEASIVNESLR